ncbi:hypothetical protein C3K47_14425 [Solitalea longa]|uniref:CAAX prenyl protease 2/Lysostaphin resistance protein A-like domain-containing protein n=1 Tax=Solitalea longa TaxID=2079460 RepID=A0A2S4ZZ08_9SPHI|nr:type II CAAX endopeptidase family protein [Solitalea longa]POY35588.1 hypothetical protein C3K47_14425 [Solitalea longa]
MPNTYPQTLKQVFFFLLFYVGIAIITSIPLIIVMYFTDSEPKAWLMSANYLLLHTGIIILYCRADWRKTFDKTFFLYPKASMTTILIIILATITSIIATDPLHAFLSLPDFAGTATKEMLETPVVGFLTICIAAPILEEIIFRGIILKGLLENYSAQKAIFSSAFIFGLIHFNPVQSIGAFVLGLLMGWLYYRTNDLRLTILVHFLNNFIGFSFSKIPSLENADSFYQIINNNTLYFSLLAVSLFVLLISLKLLDKKLALLN